MGKKAVKPLKKTTFLKTLVQRNIDLPKLPEIKLDHLYKMTDTAGMFQHAKYYIPRFTDGYCTDDNARCLLLTILLEKLGFDTEKIDTIATRCLSFLLYAFNTENNRFRNFMSFDRRWLEIEGSEDSHGRALQALGMCIGISKKRAFLETALELWEKAIRPVGNFYSIRGRIFTLLGIHGYLKRFQGNNHVTDLRDILIKKLLIQFNSNSLDNWLWFEDVASYSNAMIPRALILCSQNGKNREALSIGLKSLEWLITLQTTKEKYFRPIGCKGFYKRNGELPLFDQQPVETYAMVSACLDAYRVTRKKLWLDRTYNIFDWFLGKNDLGKIVYNPDTGGCRDGICIDGVNENEGAESTLAFLLSLTELKIFEKEYYSYPFKKQR
jgi:hypothetical protein